MMDRQDSRTVPYFKDIFENTAFESKGVMDSLDKSIDRLARTVEKESRRLRRSSRASRDSRDSGDSRDSRDYRDGRKSRDNRSYRSDSYHKYRPRSRDNSRSRSRSRGRSSKTCTYCYKPNHDLSHCYKLVKDLKKLYSGEMKIDGSRDKDEQARLQMLSCVKNYIESEKDSTN